MLRQSEELPEAEKAQTKDGAGGGPECCTMRPYLCDGRGLDQDGAGGGPRGRGMRLLKIEEARTRMRARCLTEGIYGSGIQ